MENKLKSKPSKESTSKNVKPDSQSPIPEQNDNESMTLEQENQYKEKILQLQKELEIEKEKTAAKQIDPSVIATLKNEINAKNKEIKKYANINTKQRDQLEQLSQEIDKKAIRRARKIKKITRRKK